MFVFISCFQLDEEDLSSHPLIEPDCKKMELFVRGIQKKIGLDLLGVDLIIENDTGRYAVIDINAFPGLCLGVIFVARRWTFHGHCLLTNFPSHSSSLYLARESFILSLTYLTGLFNIMKHFKQYLPIRSPLS